MKRWVRLGIGVLLALIGALWVLQGSNVITGSGMSGQKMWFLIGLIVLLGGIALAVTSGKRRKVS